MRIKNRKRFRFSHSKFGKIRFRARAEFDARVDFWRGSTAASETSFLAGFCYTSQFPKTGRCCDIYVLNSVSDVFTQTPRFERSRRFLKIFSKVFRHIYKIFSKFS